MKRVVVIASGITERRAVPHLLTGVDNATVTAEDVRFPPRHHQMTPEEVGKVIHAVWWERTGAPPDKIVVLVDTDREAPEEALADLEEKLPQRLRPEMRRAVHYAYAQRHLEAWFFADADALKKVLDIPLGREDYSRPDEMENPKLHLRHLLGRGRPYTSRVSEEIAKALDPEVIERRSPSFRGFLAAVRNGESAAGGRGRGGPSPG